MSVFDDLLWTTADNYELLQIEKHDRERERCATGRCAFCRCFGRFSWK